LDLSSTLPPPPCSTLFPYTTLFRSGRQDRCDLRPAVQRWNTAQSRRFENHSAADHGDRNIRYEDLRWNDLVGRDSDDYSGIARYGRLAKLHTGIRQPACGCNEGAAFRYCERW